MIRRSGRKITHGAKNTDRERQQPGISIDSNPGERDPWKLTERGLELEDHSPKVAKYLPQPSQLDVSQRNRKLAVSEWMLRVALSLSRPHRFSVRHSVSFCDLSDRLPSD